MSIDGLEVEVDPVLSFVSVLWAIALTFSEGGKSGLHWMT